MIASLNVTDYEFAIMNAQQRCFARQRIRQEYWPLTIL